ncbi:MAG: adenylate/guanylate cyclase domain-containing protein [Thermodesulfobacteriota bacterium]
MGAVTVERSVLFADIAGSTRLVVEQGDDAARLLLVRYVDLLASTALRFGGEIANRLGDEVFCVFERADDAVEAAVAMHEGVEAASAGDRLDRPIRLRIGFLHGSVVRSEEGWFGGTVHRAARLVALAKAGQTLTTRATLDRLAPRWRRAARWFDRCVLRGDSGEEEIHELLWDASFTSVLDAAPMTTAAAGRSAGVVLRHGERSLRVDVARPRAELGRDPSCDLQIATAAVSRLHAIVEWNRDRVRLTDVSTNGTTIERTGAAPLRLHHESALLEGEGTLRLGGAAGPDDASRVSFRCTTRAG